MRHRFLLVVSFVVLGFSVAAHASTIAAGVYNRDDASVDGHSLAGTVTSNSGGNPKFDNPGLPYFNAISSTSVYDGPSSNYIDSSSNTGQIALYLDTIASADGQLDLCIGGTQCGISMGTELPSTLQIYDFYNNAIGSNPGLAVTDFSSEHLESVNATAGARTPETSSLLFLGTGIVGLAGFARMLKS